MEMDTSSNHPWLAFSLSHQSNLILQQAFSSPTSPHSGAEEKERGVNICGAQLSYGTELKTMAPDFSPELLPEPKKTVESFGQRTSIYRGVTRHRWTGRYEAHLWDNSCRREGQNRKGCQVYLGGYDKEEKAARSYDLATLKYWGTTTTTNFPITDYEKEIEEMKHMTRLEFVASLRRKSSGFSRGASVYRGVTRHHQHGRWQARIGRVAGNKDLYLGTFSTEEEAGEAYDIAAIKFRGLNAVTNFEISRYDVESIASGNLPIAGGGSISAARSSKQSDQLPSCSSNMMNLQNRALIDSRDSSTSSLNYFTPLPTRSDMADYWSLLDLQNQHNTQQESNNNNQSGLDLGLGFGNFFSGTNLDFSKATSSSSSSSCYNTSNGTWINDGSVSLVQQNRHSENNNVCTADCSSHNIPVLATPVAFGMAGSSNGYEISPLTYYYQQAAFQTVPIFGME